MVSVNCKALKKLQKLEKRVSSEVNVKHDTRFYSQAAFLIGWVGNRPDYRRST